MYLGSRLFREIAVYMIYMIYIDPILNSQRSTKYLYNKFKKYFTRQFNEYKLDNGALYIDILHNNLINQYDLSSY